MCCWGCTSSETKRIWECKDTLLATKNTQQLDELPRMSKGVTWNLADNFWELKTNVATFMSIMWVLFGSECNYYKGLCNIYGVLNLKEVMAQKQAFTTKLSCRITWAIIDNGHAYLDDVKTTLDFPGPNEPVFLTSLTYSRMYCMQHQLSGLTFPRSGGKRSNRPMIITEHARLAQGPNNRRGEKGQHRV